MTGIYIHGTNGSGKTTIARKLLALAKVQGTWVKEITHRQCPVTAIQRSGAPPIAFIGKYKDGTASGGMDTVYPYANGINAAISLSRQGVFVFLEGLATPGIATSIQLAKGIIGMKFFWLNTDVAECIRSTQARRDARGTTKKFDTYNLIDKVKRSESWIDRCTAAGLDTERGGRIYVFNRCKRLLGLAPWKSLS
jgi:hypothetical protein